MKHKILNNKYPILNAEKGFVVSIITFFILIIMISITVGMAALTLYRQKISTNSVKSTQSYYGAEAGIEDALMALRNSPSMAAKTYSLTVSNTTVDITIPAIVGTSRAIVSQGSTNNIIRKIQTVYSVNSQGIAFNYGAQVGDGGMTMNNGSRVQGNVFSNGNITGPGTVDNNVTVSKNGNKIDGPHVIGNVLSYSCLNSTVDGNLTYVVGVINRGTNTCTVAGSVNTQPNEITPEPLPISQTQIDNWKTDATNGSVVNGNYNIGNNQSVSLGPVKITGNLIMGNNSILTINGTIYVVGDIIFGNTDTIRLASSYGSLGGVIVLDGTVDTGNSSTLSGSGQAGSYLLILSTSTSSSALQISNNATGALFYASAGTVVVNNNVQVKGLTGYRISLNNNATIIYESGLANTQFTSGPSGGWKVSSWGEQ